PLATAQTPVGVAARRSTTTPGRSQGSATLREAAPSQWRRSGCVARGFSLPRRLLRYVAPAAQTSSAPAAEIANRSVGPSPGTRAAVHVAPFQFSITAREWRRYPSPVGPVAQALRGPIVATDMRAPMPTFGNDTFRQAVPSHRHATEPTIQAASRDAAETADS